MKKIFISTGILASMVVVGTIFWRIKSSPKSALEDAFGVELPAPARNISATQVWMPDSKIVKIWGVMELPLSDAESFAQKLDVSVAPTGNSVTFPVPNPPQAWWPIGEYFAKAPYKWLREGPDFKPAFFAMSWENGKLCIFYYGISDLAAKNR
jgi:hypothetical protein